MHYPSLQNLICLFEEVEIQVWGISFGIFEYLVGCLPSTVTLTAEGTLPSAVSLTAESTLVFDGWRDWEERVWGQYTFSI